MEGLCAVHARSQRSTAGLGDPLFKTTDTSCFAQVSSRGKARITREAYFLLHFNLQVSSPMPFRGPRDPGADRIVLCHSMTPELPVSRTMCFLFWNIDIMAASSRRCCWVQERPCVIRDPVQTPFARCRRLLLSRMVVIGICYVTVRACRWCSKPPRAVNSIGSNCTLIGPRTTAARTLWTSTALQL